MVNFGESQVGGQVVRDPDELIPALRRLAGDGPLFFKDTTDFHYPFLLADQAFLAGPVHTFLIRHPAEAIASHFALHPGLQRDEIGFAWLAELYRTRSPASPACRRSSSTPTIWSATPARNRAGLLRRGGSSFPAGITFLVTGNAGRLAADQQMARYGKQASGFVRTNNANGVVVEENPLLAGYVDSGLLT